MAMISASDRGWLRTAAAKLIRNLDQHRMADHCGKPDVTVMEPHMDKRDADALGKTLVGLTAHLKGEIAGLERRITELEARPSLEFCGTFETGRNYRRGSVVTEDGSMFVALIDSPDGRPGEVWRLASCRQAWS